MIWFGKARSAPRPRADRMRIAVLEWELFGIEPEPGSAAAFAVAVQQAFGRPAQSDEPAAVIGFPPDLPRREICEFAAAYAQLAASARPVVRPDGSVEILYQHPSAGHLEGRPAPRPGARLEL